MIWDPDRNKPVARFVNGRLDTTDPRVIELAAAAGFAQEASSAPAAAPSTHEAPAGHVADHLTELSKSELLELAEERGADVRKSWTVDRIRDALRAQE